MATQNLKRITKLELQQLNTTLVTENAKLREENSQLRADLDAAKRAAAVRPAPTVSKLRQRGMQALARKFRRSVRYIDGRVEMYSAKRGWVTVPEAAVREAAEVSA